jgi:hypothetical protein
LNVIVILGFLLAAWLFYVAGSRRNRSDESRPKTDPSKPEQPGPPKRTSVRVAQLAKSILSFGKLLSVDKFLSFGSLFGALIGTVNLDVHDLAKLQATAMVPISLSGSLVNYAPSTTPQNISIRLQSASAGTIAVDCNINDRKAELTPRYTVRFTANSDDPQDEKDNLRKNVERIVDAIVVAKGSKNLTGLLLIGSADKRPLLEPLRKIYGSNEGLAQKRITVTRDALQMEFQKRNLKFPDTVIDAISGPSIYDGNRDDMAPDRSVRVCRFWS